MQPHDWAGAGRRYAQVNDLRVELTTAVVEGDFGKAYGAAGDALRLIDENLSKFDDPADFGATPYKAQAVAVFSDLLVAGTASGSPTAMEGIVLEAGPSVRFVLDEFRNSGWGTSPTNTPPRECPHNRPSYDGSCLSSPPCP
jgi:hypothetical protein